MHGVCGDVFAFKSWIRAASTHGTLIAMRGDTTCDARRLRQKWSYDMRRLDRRIRQALTAVDSLRQQFGHAPPLDPSATVLIGYSQGAHIAQWMANHKPERYRRLVLIALAKQPRASRLRGTARVLLMAGSRDARRHIRAGYDKLLRAGLSVRYLELPGARHGE
jgi:pimeloyl-ACP methyl ester carboxylesterase